MITMIRPQQVIEFALQHNNPPMKKTKFSNDVAESISEDASKEDKKKKREEGPVEFFLHNDDEKAALSRIAGKAFKRAMVVARLLA